MKDLFDGLSPLGESLNASDWPPKRAALKPRWSQVVGDFFRTELGQALEKAVQEELDAGVVIYPPHPLRLLQALSPDEVRVSNGSVAPSTVGSKVCCRFSVVITRYSELVPEFCLAESFQDRRL